MCIFFDQCINNILTYNMYDVYFLNFHIAKKKYCGFVVLQMNIRGISGPGLELTSRTFRDVERVGAFLMVVLKSMHVDFGDVIKTFSKYSTGSVIFYPYPEEMVFD